MIEAVDAAPGVGNAWVVSVDASDVDNDTLSTSVTAADAHVQIADAGAGQFAVSVDDQWALGNPGAQVLVTVTVDDGQGATATQENVAIGTINNAIAVGDIVFGQSTIRRCRPD